MKHFLIATTVIEGVTGAGLLLVPDLVVRLLLGADISGLAFPLARIAGAALLALAVACWLARGDLSEAARGIVVAMALYNLAAVVVLGIAGFQTATTTVLLWLAVVLHAGMAAGCARLLSRDTRGRPQSPG